MYRLVFFYAPGWQTSVYYGNGYRIAYGRNTRSVQACYQPYPQPPPGALATLPITETQHHFSALAISLWYFPNRAAADFDIDIICSTLP